MRTNRHTIVIATHDAASLKKEIIRWGEASWWPQRSLMKFVRLTPGETGRGSLYRQHVLLPFAPSWKVEISAIADRGITRTFLDGMFGGSETVSFAELGSGMRVDYEMRYEVRGVLNRLLWPVFFRHLHDRNIKEILKGLKAFMEKA